MLTVRSAGKQMGSFWEASGKFLGSNCAVLRSSSPVKHAPTKHKTLTINQLHKSTLPTKKLVRKKPFLFMKTAPKIMVFTKNHIPYPFHLCINKNKRS